LLVENYFQTPSVARPQRISGRAPSNQGKALQFPISNFIHIRLDSDSGKILRAACQFLYIIMLCSQNVLKCPLKKIIKIPISLPLIAEASNKKTRSARVTYVGYKDAGDTCHGEPAVHELGLHVPLQGSRFLPEPQGIEAEVTR